MMERLTAQRFALLALGRTWTLFGSRKNSKPEKCLGGRLGERASGEHRPAQAHERWASPASSARFVGQFFMGGAFVKELSFLKTFISAIFVQHKYLLDILQ